MPMPKLTNCVRVQLDFVLEFEQLEGIPREIWKHAPEFVKGGVLRLFPRKVVKERFGDIFLVLDQNTKLTIMRPRDVEKRKATFIRWVQNLDASREAKGALLRCVEKVGTRGQEKEQGAVTVGRGRDRGGRRRRSKAAGAAKKRTR